ncbi:MAG TPA: hypothetical protein EYO51_06020 [Methylococcaceae bacterium]|jgi:hypothetical protein|nr:hypothetical protein [Methylococcaceae bacterium]HIN69003.1 hypothetical protein [Methylococcales bacterium]HIA44584.1 hypothetical protein [Methylococcaceae bacterium]HIB62683.1 hypothetical protein [Methylococcaceae bacterium]HIO13279.1 hypothetical protein [Methylococcales bacterium]
MKLKSAIVLSTLTLFGLTNISYAGSIPIASPELLLLTLFATTNISYSESNKYVPLNTSSSVVKDNEISDPDPTTVSDGEIDFRHAVNEAIGVDYGVYKAQARHYFCESLFWASESKQAAKITWQ